MKIMINGRSLVGKDETADYLVSKYRFKKIAFSEPLYWIHNNIFRQKQKNRKLLQAIGQFGRFFYRDIWIKIALWKSKKYENVVWSDVRQENEYLIGYQNGFIPLRVKADLNTRIERCKQRDGIEPDISLWEKPVETGADNFFYNEIENNGSLEELYQKIDKVMEGFNETT